MVAQRPIPPAQTLQPGVCRHSLCPGIKNEIKKKKIMSRKSGHFHSNLGCEAAGDSLPSNSCRFLPSPPPQLCYLLPAPAPTPSRTHPLRHSGFSLHPPSQSTRPHKLHLAGMKEREQHHTGIIRSYTGGHHLLLEGASIARG